MSGLELPWSSCCPLILERVETMCHEEAVKICVSKQQLKYSIFGQEKEQTLQRLSSRLTQGLHQQHHPHQSSSYNDKFWFLILNSQSHINHIYKTGVSDRVRKGSLHQIHLLKSLVSFLLHSFQKKDDFGSDMLAMEMCHLWMIKENNNHIHFLIADG